MGQKQKKKGGWWGCDQLYKRAQKAYVWTMMAVVGKSRKDESSTEFQTLLRPQSNSKHQHEQRGGRNQKEEVKQK